MLYRPVHPRRRARPPAPACALAAAERAGRNAVLLLLVVLAGCTAPACTTVPLADLRLSDEPTGLYVPVAIDGRPMKLLLDTGSTRSLLTSETARRLGLPIERLLDDTDVLIGFAIEGFGGRRHVDRAWPHRIELGHALLLGVALSVVWSRNTAWDPSADGILGMDILTRYDLDLDLARSRLALYAPGAMCPPPPDAHAWTMRVDTDLVDAGARLPALLDGQGFDALIDTGAQRSSITAQAALRLGIGAHPGMPVTIYGVGPSRENAAIRQFDTLSVGSIVVRRMPLAVLNAPGLSGLEIVLGTDVLAHTHLWLSARSHFLSLAQSRAGVP